MTNPNLKTTLFIFLILSLSTKVNASKMQCKDSERQALLKFKSGLNFFRIDILSSWGTTAECCRWLGVRCHPDSGHVIGLDLSPPRLIRTEFDGIPLLSGNMSSSLLDLTQLRLLDLSHVSFYEPSDSIPAFVGGLSELRHLNLSYTTFTGEVPSQLGNLSRLEVLALSDTFKRTKTISKLDWLSKLSSSLRVVDLSLVDLSLCKDWLSVFGNMPNLEKLELRLSRLDSAVADQFSFYNLSKRLDFVDLSGNVLEPSIFEWFFRLSNSLAHLDLNFCSLRSSIPQGIERLKALEYLDLGANMLVGEIPDSIGNLTALRYLNLGLNNLRGFIPNSLGKMAQLEYLDLGTNSLEGEIPRSIWEICTLKNFQGDENNLTGPLWFSQSSSKCDHFELESLNLEQNRIWGSLSSLRLYPHLKSVWLQSNHLNGSVSESIGLLSQLETLDVSRNNIQTMISDTHLSKLFNLKRLDFSLNSRIVFNISSNFVPPFQLDYILLQSCKLGPKFPKWIRNQKSYTEIDISNSEISDSIPSWFWNLSRTAYSFNLSNNQIPAINRPINSTFFNLSSPDVRFSVVLDLSSNKLRGSVPMFLFKSDELHISNNQFSDFNSICSFTDAIYLNHLDLSNNSLSGKLLDCWSNTPNMETLTLSNNRLSGKLPSSIGLMTQVSELHLSYNKFIGQLPSSLQNCSQLTVLDAGDNGFSGMIPAWIGTNLLNLVVLNLRNNRFSGIVPTELCDLANLQVVDLSSNNFSRPIPDCLRKS